MDAIVINNLHKSFGEKKVLQGLDMCVPEHSVFGFVGKNGAGKTTTMKAILGLFGVDAGEIYVCGERVCFGKSETNRNVGYLPDVPEFYPFMTPKEYLKLCGECLDMKPSEIEKRSAELLCLVGLEGEDRRIKGFSRGMKQRLGIASALLARPKILICDEPTSALDPIGRKEILDLLLAVREQTTVLFSTHILSDVERICTDVALIHDGRIARFGPVNELKIANREQKFTVELIDTQTATTLKNAFADAELVAPDTLVFCGTEDKLFEIMDFLSKNKLGFTKIERAGVSLEDMFLEVVSK